MARGEGDPAGPRNARIGSVAIGCRRLQFHCLMLQVKELRETIAEVLEGNVPVRREWNRRKSSERKGCCEMV